MERRIVSGFCLTLVLFLGLSAKALLIKENDVSIQTLYPKGFVNQCLKMTSGSVVGWAACVSSAGNGGTLGSLNNGDVYSTISNGTGYYTTLRINNSAIYNGSIFNTAFAAKTTTDLTEGTNLYYTAARANGDALQVGTEQGWASNINGLSDAKSNIASVYLGNGSGLSDTMASNTYSTAIGTQSLQANLTGSGLRNTATGYQTLFSNTTGDDNTASGYQALYNNISGHFNITSGYKSLFTNSTGQYNVGMGYLSGYSNSIGSANIAVGASSLYGNTASFNTCVGYFCMYANTAGNGTGLGAFAGYNNTIGKYNTGIGQSSLYYNQTGSKNTALGYLAGEGTSANSFSNGTFLGYGTGLALTTGANNTLIGYQAGDTITTGSGNIIIGNDVDVPSVTASNQLVIGNLIYGNGTSAIGGKVGINKGQPAYTLDVNGTTFTKGFNLNGNTFVASTLAQGSLLVAKASGAVKELVKGTNHYALKVNGNKLAWETDIDTSSGGTVTSVAASGDNGITILSGSPVTTIGTIAFSFNQGATLRPSQNLSDLASASTARTNLALVPGTDVFTQRTFTGDNGISLTNADGVSAAPRITFDSSLINAGTVTRVFNGDIFTTVANQTTTPAISLASNTSANWATKFSDETGTSKIVFNGSPSITSPTLTGATLNRVTTFNGNTMSIPSLTQGDILFSKVAGSIINLAKGANHYFLVTNGNKLAYENALLSPVINKNMVLNGTTFSLPTAVQGDILYSKIAGGYKPLVKGTNHYALKVNGNKLAWEQSPTGSGNTSGTNTGDQTITLTGDVTGSGTGSFATTVASQTSSNWIGKVSDETGTGKWVFNGSPSMTSPTLTNPTFNRAVTWNGTTFSLPALTQGDILFAKTTSTVKPLAKGTNHYILKVNGNKLAWESNIAGAFNIDGLSDAKSNVTNVYLGNGAGAVDTGSSYSTGAGIGALKNNDGISGIYNSAFGYQSMNGNTSGNNNAAIGTFSLYNNTSGYYNVASGALSSYSNTTGSENTASGALSSYSNTTGSENTASGAFSLYNNASGSQNTAIGYASSNNNTTGSNGTFLGSQAGFGNTTGKNNIAIGYKAGDNITTGSNNIIIGFDVNGLSATAFKRLNIGNVIYGDLNNGNVGINNTSPTARLHVSGNTIASVGTTPGTAAGNSITVAGIVGGATTIATTGVGGIGSPISFTSGAGGTAASAVTSSTGGAGGGITLTPGAGGAAAVAGAGTNNGGIGGALNLTGATGGSAIAFTSGTSRGGVGSIITITGGTGGAANTGNGTLISGAGGAVSISGGTGGLGTTGVATGGAGGAITLSGGVAAAMAGAAGGAASLNGRAGSSTGSGGAGGAVSLVGGNAGGDNTVNRAGGTVTITSGNAKGGSAGALITIASGNGGSNGGTATARGAVGGGITLNPGDGGTAPSATTSSTGGTGGAGTFSGGVGGAAAVAGTGDNIGGVGGAYTFTSGIGGAATGNTTGNNTGGAGAAFNLNAGTGGAASTVNGTPGTMTGGVGGNMVISAGIGGAATVPGAGGVLTFRTAATTSITERMRITNGGNVGIGTTAPFSLLDITSTTGGVQTISRNDTTVTAADSLGIIQFFSNDASTTTNFVAANIEAQATNTIATDINPGRLIFRTTPTTVAATPTERMRITETGNIGIADQSPDALLDINGSLAIDKTITAGGTTGAQTINKAAGSVNFATAATSLVVTNNLVTTSSVILCTVGTNDTTMKSAACVAAAGSFTMYANAAATAETRVNFLVIN